MCQHKVSVWDHGTLGVVFGEVCLELACLSDVQLCGVRDHKILSCCHIPGNSPVITKMLH